MLAKIKFMPFSAFFQPKTAPSAGRFFIKRTIYLAAPILNILVPQTGHAPVTAGLPFFIFISLASFMVFLALHLTQ